MSELSKARVQDTVTIPDTLEHGNFSISGIKKYKPFSQLVKAKIDEQYPNIKNEPTAQYFVEVQDKLLLQDDTYLKYDDKVLEKLNREFRENEADSKQQRIGLLYLGRSAPGGNNIVDGLLRYQKLRKNVQLYGFVNGIVGIMNNQYVEIKEETYKPFRNLGGYDYLGRSLDILRTPEQLSKTIEICKTLKLTGLIIVGATHSLTDTTHLTEHFLQHKVDTKVIGIPATVDGNIHHGYISISLGFDTASKVYSQLIGNMLTDSASAIKYWYFIRLMGQDPSHLALECALNTHPNVVIISEECAQRGETLVDVVNRICDVIELRAAHDKNYGAILIPEGLLNHVAAYKHLIDEINDLFSECKNR